MLRTPLTVPTQPSSVLVTEDARSQSSSSYSLTGHVHPGRCLSPLDLDQRASRELRTPSSPSAPFDGLPASTSTSTPSSQISSSPAALFLSAFSSPTTRTASLPDDEGQSVAGYVLGPVIAHGGCSVIRRATSVSGGPVAVKIVRRATLNAGQRSLLEREATVWPTLSHEHILPLFAAERTSFADFLIMPFCPAGTLFDMLQREGNPALPHDDVGMMFRQVVRGLRYLHESVQLVHRDMKLENVLVDEMGICRISDFGMARYIGEVEEEKEEEDEGEYARPRVEHTQTVSEGAFPTHSRRQTAVPLRMQLSRHTSLVDRRKDQRKASSPFPAANEAPSQNQKNVQPGSWPYAAPELLNPPTATSPGPQPAQDVWALGVMLFTMLTGRLPFNDSYVPRLQMKILHGVYEYPSRVGAEAERVIAGCLSQSVDERWTVAAVDEVAWGVGWNAIGDVDEDAHEEHSPTRVDTRGSSRARRSLSRSVVSSQSRSPVRTTMPSRRTSYDRYHGTSPPRPLRRRTSPSSVLLARSDSLGLPPVLSPTTSMSSMASVASVPSPSQSLERDLVHVVGSPMPAERMAVPTERGRKGFRSQDTSIGCDEATTNQASVSFATNRTSAEYDEVADLAHVSTFSTSRSRPFHRTLSGSRDIDAQRRAGSMPPAHAPWFAYSGWSPAPSQPAPPVATSVTDKLSSFDSARSAMAERFAALLDKTPTHADAVRAQSVPTVGLRSVSVGPRNVRKATAVEAL